jgi:hypothetical protein
MSRNGSGTYSLPAGNPVVTGTTISSTWANTTLNDIANALTGSLATDGQTTATGNLKMGGNKITGLANGTLTTDAATVGQIPDLTGYLTSADIGVTVEGYDANIAKLNVTEAFTKGQSGAVTALTDGSTITPNFANSNNFSVTLGGNRTLANPSNIVAGQSGIIVITQDSTGSRTLAYGSYWKFAGGTAPTLTTTANAVDVLAYYTNSTTTITAVLLNNVS